VFSTTAFIRPEPPPRPEPDAPRPRTADPAEGAPTVRVPVRPVADIDPLVVTPPPTSDLRLPPIDWSAEEGDEGATPAPRRGPRVGDTVMGFKLVAELGRGAFARVYRAEQQSLAGREVALKITFRPTREAERLARLQHTNIVPVYSVHADGPAQLICMPFLGRTTVADLIRAHRFDGPPRSAARRSTARAALSTAADGGRSASKSLPDSGGRSRPPVWTWDAAEPPPIVGDPVAVLEFLRQLADGLGHAHARGILHLDLKPANVLLADSGEPMLLDFNLSLDARDPDRDMVGGTMPYMAIEQLLDMRDRGSGVIDGRADLFALGVMAFEMLTGGLPFAVEAGKARDIDALVAARRAGPLSLRAANPLVTPAVEAIVFKLLAAEPEHRYQTADELHTDVTRHLADLPLKFAREPSTRERVRKWRRRNPGLAVRLLFAGLIALSAGLGVVAYDRSQSGARAAAAEHARATRSALDPVRLDLLIPEDPKAAARGAERAARLLAAYGLPADADWRTRPAVRMLPAADRAALRDDFAEVLFLVAHAKWRSVERAPDADRRAAAAEAWKWNAAARACFPAGEAPAALVRQAAALAPAAGEAFDPPAVAGANPPHLFLDAAERLSRGHYAAAVPLLDEAVSADPRHAAAQFALAYCRQQLGQHARAVERYDVARALLPADPRPAYYRGQIYGLTKKPALAETEFTAALARDPESAEAYRLRGLARYRLGTPEKLAEAEADLTAALDKGGPPVPVYALRERVRTRRGDAAGAAADRAAAAGATPATESDFLTRGWARMGADPKGALDDLRKALEINPRSLDALQNIIHVLGDKIKDDAAALEVATRATELYPDYAPVRATRGILLARLDRRADAHKDVAAARRLSEDAEVLFLAACAFARGAAANDDRAEALKLLRRALREGYSDLDALATTADLAPLRDLTEFKDIELSARVLQR
jgi:serine/threonine protein kinase